jgi:DNA-binding protein HU-beta
MTKTEFVEKLAKENGLTKTMAKEVVETFLALTTKILKKDGRVALAGLGVFEVEKGAKRTARNPRTGEPVVIKAHKAVKFKPSKALKDAIA